MFGAASLGIGFVVMAVAPTLAVAVVGAALAGVGNGLEVVAARTALQEATEEGWMALMMSLNESMFQLVPGAGILLGGAITALASPRAALAVAGVGSLLVTVLAWIALAPGALESSSSSGQQEPGTSVPVPNGDHSESNGGSPRRAAPAPVGRHQ